MAQAQNQATWFSWKAAADAVQAVHKNITITVNLKSIRNLPREGAGFGKRARETCKAIMRGQEPEMPRGFDPAAQSSSCRRARHVTWRKVESHTGHYLNERADLAGMIGAPRVRRPPLPLPEEESLPLAAPLEGGDSQPAAHDQPATAAAAAPHLVRRPTRPKLGTRVKIR